MTVGPSQAMNLGGKPGAYSDSFITLDLMKGQGDWEYWTGTDSIIIPRDDLVKDAKGWLTELPVVNGAPVGVYVNVFYGKVAPAQQYIMEWKGEGDIAVSEDYTVIGPNRILIDFKPDYGAAAATKEDGLTIALNSTDPNGTGNHIRDIQVYRAQDADLIAAGERFNPDWFDRVDDFRILRTHDWQSTNFPTQVDWTRNSYSANQADWGLEGRGMPYALLVDMANQTRSDLWINIPHTASDQFIREAAAYVKENLDPDLRVMAEFSNEYWTTIFDQYQYFVDGGAAEFGDADFAAGQFYGTRAADMARLFTAEFGAGSKQLRPTLTVDDAMFANGEAEIMLTAPAHVAMGGAAPVRAGFDVLATDGYLSWYGPDPATRKMILGWMKQADGGFGAARDFLLDQLENSLLPNWQKGRVLADKYGLEFMVYEGGALLLNQAPGADPRLTDFAIRFTQSAELREVYEAEMAAWASVGTGPFAWYADVGRPGPWGDYGHWKGIDFVPDPRTDVITDANADLSPWWVSDDDRPAGTFDNGIYDAGTADTDRMTGTALADRLYGLAGADTLSGGSGADRLWGGTGKDELAGSTGADELRGGRGDDVLTGGRGDDMLRGGRGADVLTGGLGADVFLFRSPAQGSDRITDFASGKDHIHLTKEAFGGQALGSLSAAAFQSGAGTVALKGGVRVLFDTETGQVWADADGRGGADPVLLVTLQPQATITAQDFLFV